MTTSVNELSALPPIESALTALKTALARKGTVLLHAEPGAGKTTHLPLALLGEPWLAGKKLIMLEPRRVAARSAAEFMSLKTASRPGDIVGYRMRGESAVSERTRLEVITEGLFTRLLQRDPALEGVALVIFDEFHERSLHSDLGLALALDVRENLRPDLKILVMSATLEVERLQTILPGAEVISSAGRSYPVEVQYAPYDGMLSRAIARNLPRALPGGDTLVFLPGRREISHAREELEKQKLRVSELSSDTSVSEQRKILGRHEEPHIILSTSVAETSVTLQGVKTVIDCGLTRMSRFDPARGMSELVTVSVSKASAEQRAGRAGRVSAGRAIRLWEEGRALLRFYEPEIRREDLTSFALELAAWGTGDTEKLRFLDAPPAGSYAYALEILRGLGAIEKSGMITPHGRELASFGSHPRLAHMMLRGKALGVGSLACEVAAVLEEIERFSGELFSQQLEEQSRRAAGRVTQLAERFRKQLGVERERAHDFSQVGLLVMQAYPERIGRKRGRGYLLANGVGAKLREGSPLMRSEFLAVCSLDGAGDDAKIFVAEPVTEEEIRLASSEQIVQVREVRWNSETSSVLAKEFERLGAVTLRERSVEAEVDEVSRALLTGIRELGLEVLPWSREANSLVERSEWIRRSGIVSAWPDLSREELLDSLDDWLLPYLPGLRTVGDLSSLPLEEMLLGRLSREERTTLAKIAPASLELPSGTKLLIEYDSQPRIRVHLQELFGFSVPPSIGGGRLVIELLSPAGRPIQVTSDLKSFWTGAYREVRREMMVKYPKHVWPEDPLSAKPVKKGLKRNNR